MNSMKYYCELKKRKIQIFTISLNLLSFIILSLYLENKNLNYCEYTALPKSCSNIYIIMILLLLLLHSIFPSLICKLITENLAIITNNKGKIIILLSIGIQFVTSNNYPHILYATINFVSSFILILCEFMFNCNIGNKMNQNGHVNKNNDKQMPNQENDISNNNNNIHINLIMNKNDSSSNDEHQKNGSNFPFFENDQKKDNNYFENIKQANLKAQNSNNI